MELGTPSSGSPTARVTARASRAPRGRPAGDAPASARQPNAAHCSGHASEARAPRSDTGRVRLDTRARAEPNDAGREDVASQARIASSDRPRVSFVSQRDSRACRRFCLTHSFSVSCRCPRLNPVTWLTDGAIGTCASAPHLFDFEGNALAGRQGFEPDTVVQRAVQVLRCVSFRAGLLQLLHRSLRFVHIRSRLLSCNMSHSVSA